MKRLCCLLIAASAFLVGAPAAQADLIFSATLLGSNETPPPGNITPATGFALVTLHSDNTLNVHETFSGLIGGIATGAHIHCCAPPGTAASIAVPFLIPPFPAATSGVFDQTFDLSVLSTYSSAFITASGGTLALTEAAFINGLEAGLTYANIHNARFPGGEIRGQLLPVPEPASLALLGSALLGFGVIRRRKKHP